MPENPEKLSEEKSGSKSKKVPKIHTMPEKFYIVEKGGKGGKNTFLVAAIIILVVVIIGGGAFFIMQRLNQPEENDNENLNIQVVNTETNVNNANANTNANLNANVNTNANTNISTNVNIGNINLFANTNANTNTAVNVNTTIPSSQDTDSDGLTDVEEGLFGTNVSVPDSDEDGYADGQEVEAGYDPNGSSRLEQSAKIQPYTNSQEQYTLLYPVSWVVADDPQNTRGKIFTTSGEFVSVSVQENPARLSARDWYLTKSPGVSSASIATVANWTKTLSGAKSLDGLTIYYTKGEKVYVISYNTNILSQANYKATFTMMYKSFTTTEPATNTNTSTNINGNTNTAINTNANSNANSNLNTNSNLNSNVNGNTNSNTNSNANTNRL